jgi:hypothetical protein
MNLALGALSIGQTRELLIHADAVIDAFAWRSSASTWNPSSMKGVPTSIRRR